MKGDGPFSFQGSIAVLATMHGKERVITPLLAKTLGLRIERAPDLNTDRFGTFSHEIERTGSQLDAARAKIAAAFERVPTARVGIASEGSFGPHPSIPFVPLGRELVLFIDRETGLELTGYDVSLETNFGHAIVSDVQDAFTFAKKYKFPKHGLIVLGCVNDQPSPAHAIIKDIIDHDSLEIAVRTVIAKCGSAFVETDMRAHRNPTRMRSIKRATSDLVNRFNSRCPSCSYPGFSVTERVAGLPCEWCGEPTMLTQYEVSCCHSCGYREERSATDKLTADPGQCQNCNP